MIQNSHIVVVSGLPRSGTSLMMQMLNLGGIEVLTDRVRSADIDNPRGYLEFERAKQVHRDADWVPQARGKAVKMVSQLLYHLPEGERYRIIFMRRNLDEVLLSQEKMLLRRGSAVPPRDKIRDAFSLHLDGLYTWLSEQPHVDVLFVDYNKLLESPHLLAAEVKQFLQDQVDCQAMLEAVDPDLYRNRCANPTQ